MKSTISIALAFLSAIISGYGSAYQAKSAQQSQKKASPIKGKGDHFTRTLNAMLQPTFIFGTLCNIIGFIISLGADRWGELFLVQPITATNIFFATLFCAIILKTKLDKNTLKAIILISISLVCLGISAGKTGQTHTLSHDRLYFLGSSIAAIVLGILVIIFSHNTSRKIIILSALAGALYGIDALCSRVITGIFDLGILNIAIASAAAFYFYTSAISKGSMAEISGIITSFQTLLPATIGIVVFHDSIRQGFFGIVLIGLVFFLGGIWFLLGTPQNYHHEKNSPA